MNVSKKRWNVTLHRGPIVVVKDASPTAERVAIQDVTGKPIGTPELYSDTRTFDLSTKDGKDVDGNPIGRDAFTEFLTRVDVYDGGTQITDVQQLAGMRVIFGNETVTNEWPDDGNSSK